MRLILAALAVFILNIPAAAQATQVPAPPPVTAENIRDLRPVHTVRFDELKPFTDDPTGGMPLSGWFTMSPNGELLTFVIEGGVRIFGLETPTGIYREGATVIDARWDDASRRLAIVAEHEGGYSLWFRNGLGVQFVSLALDGVPVRVWFDAELPEYVWLEITPTPENPDRSGYQVVRLQLRVEDPTEHDPVVLPTGPEHDFDSFVRIGRIPAPLAITATLHSTVRLWDLQTSEITAEVELPVLPTFGRINETNGAQFAWRDENSEALHLLDFTTGEDKVIAPLHGEYIQALLLSPDASVILAVHRGDDPTVTAWITATGEEISFGEYDTSICSRVPDMVQLSRDGTRLVIGCDGGFEVWQVAGE